MYRSPEDDEQRRDEEQDDEETGGASRVRPRQSASSRKPSAKTRKVYYSDDHPEVPKIRRASLKQTRVEVMPQANEELLEHDETEPHRLPPATRRRKPRVNTPLTGIEDEELPEHGETEPHHLPATRRRKPRVNTPLTGLEEEYFPAHDETEPHRLPTTRRKPRSEMLPFTGMEKLREKDFDTAYHETVRKQRSNQNASPATRRRSTTQNRHHASNRSRTRVPYLGRRQSWILIGVLALIILVTAPFLSKLFNSASSSLQNAGPNVSTQGISLQRLQNIPSNIHELVIAPPASDHPAPPIYATSAFVLDADSETTLYAQNPFLHLPMLSTTKLMTATLAVQMGNMDQQITISAAMEHDIQQLSSDSALFGVKQGQTYSLRELLYGLLYVSGNDAALVIADALSGSVPNFVAQMNQKAQDLGLHDTHFVNPHGLLNAGQYSCARDLAVLGQYALSIPLIQQISSGKTYHIAAGGNHDARVLLNENQFIWWYPGVTGGKTGFDGVNDFIQVMSVTRNNRHMIGVVMHSNDWWTDMRDLMDYGSNDYTWVSPHDADAAGQPVPYDSLWNYFAKDTQNNTIQTADNGLYFIKTGYSVSGPVLSYFNQQGGLDKFGFPTRAPVPTSSTVMSQQFQHGAIQCDLNANTCRTI